MTAPHSETLKALQSYFSNENQPVIDNPLKSEINSHIPADIADFFEAISSEHREELWSVIDDDLKGEVLTELHDAVRQQVIAFTENATLVEAVKDLDPDDLADIDADLPQEVYLDVLSNMDVEWRKRFLQVRDYPDDTAGGLMNSDAILVRDDVQLSVVARYLRLKRQQNANHLPEHMNAVMVVDDDNHYQGLLYLSDLVTLPEETLVSEVIDRRVPAVAADMDEKAVARFFANRDLISAAVTDSENKLIGRITIDDVVDVLRLEAEDNLLSQAGLDNQTDVFAPVLTAFKQRAGWLLINICNAFISAYVISQFEATIGQIVILAALMPIVASMGGTVGMQTFTLVTRGIALAQLDQSNRKHLVSHEVSLSLLSALVWAAFVFVLAFSWTGEPAIAGVFAFSLAINLIVGVLVGMAVPITLDKFGIDPALAGGVILLALTDIVGFSCFLGLASLVLV